MYWGFLFYLNIIVFFGGGNVFNLFIFEYILLIFYFFYFEFSVRLLLVIGYIFV